MTDGSREARMKGCAYCEPGRFGNRKLGLDDKYWYLAVPCEIGVHGQLMLVVKKLPTDTKHVSDIADVLLGANSERLTSVMQGIHVVATRLKKELRDRQDRQVEKVYVLTQCEGKASHLHFHFYPRYQGEEHTGNEFLYVCELEEARWQKAPKVAPAKRIQAGKAILRRHQQMIRNRIWDVPASEKKEILDSIIEELNRIFSRSSA